MQTLEDLLVEMKATRKPYYVYVLYKPDGTPFYVGKGTFRVKDQRVTWHEYEAALPAPHASQPHWNDLKVNTIRKIWRLGGDVLYAIDSWHDVEKVCLDREKELIAEIGRRLPGTGPLTNLSDGGEDECGSKSESTKNLISQSLKTYYQEHPEVLERLSEQKKQWANDPEVRRQMSEWGKQGSAHLVQWMRDNPEGVQERNRKHGEVMLEWHATEAGKAKTKIVAEKRNAKFRTDEHRKHMAAKTSEYAKNNPEAWKQSRAKSSETFAKKAEARTKCYTLVRDRLVAAGLVKSSVHSVSTVQIGRWREAGKIPPDILAILDGPAKTIADWTRILEQLSSMG